MGQELKETKQNISKEIEIIKKGTKQILELKGMITEMKNSLERYNSRFEKAEEPISQLDEPIEVIRNEEQKEKRMKKNEQSKRLEDTIQYQYVYWSSRSRGKKGTESMLKK